jgi:hypothetical protein
MNDFGKDLDVFGQVTEPIFPERVYINLSPIFASLIITVPNLQVNLPENPSIAPNGELSVIILNNGRLKRDPINIIGLSGANWNAQTTIESVNWHGKIILGQQLIKDRKQLLFKFFIDTLGNKETVDTLRQQWEQIGLHEGKFLYRAISNSELRELKENGCKYVSHLDPSANFESEDMFSSEYSQAKIYSSRTKDGYSGWIIRWKIEDPLFYRPAGLSVRRIVPMFSHYFPQEIEISNNDGESFNLFTPSKFRN